MAAAIVALALRLGRGGRPGDGPVLWPALLMLVAPAEGWPRPAYGSLGDAFGVLTTLDATLPVVSPACDASSDAIDRASSESARFRRRS